MLTVTPLPPTVTGGIEEYAYRVVESLRSDGARVTVVTTRYDRSTLPPRSAGGYLFLDAKELLGRPLCVRPRAVVDLLAEIRGADLVHIHSPFPFIEAIAAVLGRLAGKPVLVTYHMDATVESEPNGRGRFLSRLVEALYRAFSARPTLRFADRVCTNTRAYADQSPVLRGALGKLVVVHQGVDARKFEKFSRERAAELRSRLLGAQYDRLVCFVGRLVPYKGLPVLLDAIPAVGDARTLFVIGGRGPQEPLLRERVRRENLSNVRFLGYVPDEDLLNLFVASDLVVSPSVSLLESTPITLLYAQAVGTRTIGTDIGGTGECLANDGRAGRIVPANDARALSAAIVELLKVRAAPPRAAVRFWSDVAAAYARLMGELLESPRPARISRSPGPVMAGREG